MNNNYNEFEAILRSSSNDKGIAIIFIISWIAASDGTIHQSEERRIREIAKASGHSSIVDILIGLVNEQNLDSFQHACEILSKSTNSATSLVFMQMAIGIAVADGQLTTPENHILMLIADILGLSRKTVNSIFSETTGIELPQPSDPSHASYWQASHGKSERSQRANSKRDSEPRGQPTIVATRAFAILGLEPGAPEDQIVKSYRRLAQIHHPDRFTHLGHESVAAATTTFQRIKSAYDYLVKSA